MHRGWGHASTHTRKGGVPGPKGLKRDRSGEAGRGLRPERHGCRAASVQPRAPLPSAFADATRPVAALKGSERGWAGPALD